MFKTNFFSRRTNWPLEDNAISLALKRLKDNNVSVADLTESNPTRCRFAYLNDGLLKPLGSSVNTQYEPSPRGSLKARQAISRYYGERGVAVDPERIFLTAGSSEAYSFLMRLCVQPGERVLFPRPSYPLFSFLGDLNDVQLNNYHLRFYGSRWEVDVNGLKESVHDDTKALVAVNPNNPTGSFIAPEDFAAVNAACRDNDMALIIDEVFSDFVLDYDRAHINTTGNREVLTFTLNGISKTLGLPQMKLSWIVVSGPDELVNEALARLEVITDTYLSVNTPVQNALPEWLGRRNDIQNEIKGRLADNHQFLRDQTAAVPDCSVYRVEGGWNACLALPARHSEEEWALAFLNKDHVAVHPGYFFDFDEDHIVVLSLLPPVETFREGVRRLIHRIQS